MAIIPPDPITANVDFRYDGLYQSMVLVLLQRVIDGSSGNTVELQAILDELIELNGKAATEGTLSALNLFVKRHYEITNELLEEQRLTNKLLKKILKPE